MIPEIQLPTGTATTEALRALFAENYATPGWVELSPKTDRTIARYILMRALQRDGETFKVARPRSEELIPEGLMKMDAGHLSEGERAAVCAAMWVAGSGVTCWQHARTASAFGAPWALVGSNEVAMAMLISDGAPAALLNGLTDLQDNLLAALRGYLKRD